MTDFLSSRQAAHRLGVKVGTLARAVWDGRIPEPTRSPSGAFLWEEEDLRRAAWCLLHVNLEKALAAARGAQNERREP